MRILFPHPRKSTWQAHRLTNPDGAVWFYTGYYNRWTRDDLTRRQREGARVEGVANTVFEARFRPADNGDFVDADTGAAYSISDGARQELLLGFIEGRLRAERGLMCGLFCLKKEGARVSLSAYRGPVPGNTPMPVPLVEDAPADAPDLSDFIKAMK